MDIAPDERPDDTAAAMLHFEDPMGQRSFDDTDAGWGESVSEGAGGAADLARFLDEKPPHHL